MEETVKSVERAFQVLEQVSFAKDGIGITDLANELEENELRITCVAAPICDHRKQVTAAISISGPMMRMQAERLNVLVEHCG